ncbi:hypothetical protein K0M31_002687 [Melipona bicolor]|uniref:Tetratricopeptide repeat protein n=1 Tax=Melipona bicolor TaxID=60889 RepID=A0AA40FZF8_9HYME|nr:hypothetical protein K0M31_002687 [Melipona bicolor]
MTNVSQNHTSISNSHESLAPNSPLHLSNRAHVLFLLNRPQASLTDADHAVRLRPDWGKGHYRRGVALSALGRHEEALFALCISVAIDKNPQAVRHELIKVCRFFCEI